MKPKAALVKAGIKPAGFENARGRMSRADLDAVADLAKKNPDWNIEVPGAPVPKVVAAAAPKTTVAAPKPGGTGVVDVGPPLFHEDEWDVFVTVDGTNKRWAMGPKGGCLNCKNSLTYCFCPYPVVNIDHEVKGIVTRKPKK